VQQHEVQARPTQQFRWPEPAVALSASDTMPATAKMATQTSRKR
jgi:hypothetical protein